MINFKYVETNISTKTLESNIGQIPGVHPNPRTITTLEYEKLKKSIQRNGIVQARSPIVYKYDGRHVVICGNMRLKASKEIGLTDIPVFLIDEELNADQLNELQVIENKNNGDWDWDLLANEWDDTQLEDWGLNVPSIPDLNFDEIESTADRETKKTPIQVRCPECECEFEV